MARRRTHRSHWTDSLPDDGWTHAPKVYLYRLQHPYKPRLLGVYLPELISEVDVMAYWGGGDYFFKAVHRGRVVRRGTFSIEGNPIRGFRDDEQQRVSPEGGAVARPTGDGGRSVKRR